AAITAASPQGGNDFVEQLLNPVTGVLSIAKTGKYKRVAILYTDACWGPLSASDLQRCVDLCRANDIVFYAVICNRQETEPNGIKESLQVLANMTGGFLYDGVVTSDAARNISSRLQELVAGGTPCAITWESGVSCAAETMVVFRWNASDSIRYQKPSTGVASLT